MSNSRENIEQAAEKFGGWKSGKGRERSSFAQTCSLLSQYLKEKGSLGDLSLEMNKKLEAAAQGKSEMLLSSPPTTMDLLPNIEKSPSEFPRQRSEASPNLSKSIDLIPQFAGFGSSDSVEEAITKADLRKSTTTDPGTAQMTIFYAGQVLVFDDFPSDKAKEIMLLASNGSSHIPSALETNPGAGTINLGSSIVSSSKNVSSTAANLALDRVQNQPQANGSDLPIARKVSLHRFLEKRKDRVTAKAPYQVNNPTSPPKSEDNNSWVDLEAQTSKQLELKL